MHDVPMGGTQVLYRLLGELEIGADGQLLELPGGPAIVILAALLLNVNRRVSKADLIRAAWGDEGIDDAQLHKRVKQVRGVLARIGKDGDLRTHQRFGYELRVPRDEVDSELFRQLVQDADDAAADRRAEDEIRCLRRALRLWRGPRPLSNVPADRLRAERAALQQRHKRAAVRLFELELARGNHERILDRLIGLAGYYPSDQRLCELLMIAEYRCGHLTDAAVAYERYWHALEEETGGQPDPLLQAFYYAIGGGNEDAIGVAERALAARAGRSAQQAVAVPRQLPHPPELVGREQLAAEVSWLLRRESRPAVPVLVISGPGGIGKTALALRAAHDSAGGYPGGQLFAELRGTASGPADTSEVLAQFLRALGAPRVPETKAERLAEYRTALAGRPVLIVLDDAAGGAQVADLVPANPGCAVLVTARKRLPEIAGAHHVAPLEPLEPTDATELFLRVVRDAGISIENDLEAVSRVVRLCGGLPLALRIAGAQRVHDHPRPTSELADRLARHGPGAFVYGDLSIERTIGAGYDRLDPAARRLFLGLGLIPLPGFGLWTAAAVLGDPAADAGLALSELTASFMVDADAAQMRYRLHDLTREYAHGRAVTEYPADRDTMVAGVYQALLTLLRHAHAGLYGGPVEVVHSSVPDWDAPAEVLAEVDADPMGWFEKERLNIRAAVEQCTELGLTEICWDLAVSAHEFYGRAGYFDDWHATHLVALQACRAAGDRRGEGIVIVCLNQPTLVASRRTDGVVGFRDLQHAVELLAPDRHGQAIAMRTLANALRRHGHLTRPLALFRQALERYRASGDRVGEQQALRFIGQTYLDQRDYRAAIDTLREAEQVAAGLDSPYLLAQSRYWVGCACLAADDIGGAREAFAAVFAVLGDDEAGLGRAYALHGLGDLGRVTGARTEAEERLTEAAELAGDDGKDASLEGRVLLSVAALRRDEGRPAEQVAALRKAAELFALGSQIYLEVQALAALAAALTGQGDSAGARAAWDTVQARYDNADVPAADRIYSSTGVAATHRGRRSARAAE
jgi:DNA-binding SARP family transcriptional activator/tetratricopeptide (TPR) repeat protein